MRDGLSLETLVADGLEEAEICRRRALAYLGSPEADFLLSAAREFDRLAALADQVPKQRRDGPADVSTLEGARA